MITGLFYNYGTEHILNQYKEISLVINQISLDHMT